MRTVSGGVRLAEMSVTCTPYIRVTFKNGVNGSTVYTYTTNDATRRIKNIKHTEEPYNDYGIIVLADELDTVPSLVGFIVCIDYGYKATGVYQTTGGETAPLWVTKQFKTSRSGSKDTILYCEGAWAILSRLYNVGSLLGGTAPYYEVAYSTDSVYDIIHAILTATGFSLLPLGVYDDGIIDTLCPAFLSNSIPFEDARQQVYRLINMTKCMIRVERGSWIPDDEQLWQGNIDAGGTAKVQLTDNCFRAAGLTWAFYKLYGGMRYLYYRTSYNGFASGTLVVDMGASAMFNVYFDGTYFHICYKLYAYGTYHVFYRRATPTATGTLDYSADWQDTGVIPASFPWNSFQDLAADSNHYPLVSYLGATGLEVATCNQNDGTWTSHVVTTINSTSSFVQSWLCSWASGDMYAVYQSSDGNLSGKLRTGGVWGSAETIPKPTGVHAEYFWAVSNEDDEVYVVCEGILSSLPRVYFTNRVAGVWSDAEVLYTAPYAYGFGYVSLSISVDTNGDLYVFKQDWYYDVNLVYKKRTSGVWDSNWTIIFTPPVWMPNPPYWGVTYLRMTSMTKVVDGHLGVISTYAHSTNGTDAMMKFLDLANITNPPAGICQFHIIYPKNIYKVTSPTYLSDRPSNDSYQFKDFEWRDHTLDPTHVYVLANRVDTPEGLWDADEIVSGEFVAP